MSIAGALTVPWADGNYTFRLGMSHILELEGKCGTGIRRIIRRVAEDDYSYNDVRETLRLGLIGGGLKDVEALTLVQRYVDERPNGFAEHALMARLILTSILVPFAEHPLKKAAAPSSEIPAMAQTEETTTANEWTPDRYMPTVDDLGLTLADLENFRSGRSTLS